MGKPEDDVLVERSPTLILESSRITDKALLKLCFDFLTFHSRKRSRSVVLNINSLKVEEGPNKSSLWTDDKAVKYCHLLGIPLNGLGQKASLQLVFFFGGLSDEERANLGPIS